MRLNDFLKSVPNMVQKSLLLIACAMILAVIGMGTPASGTMVQQTKLTAPDGAPNDFFGGDASLSSNGNIALISAPGKTVGGNAYQGAAYVYARSQGVWNKEAELTASDGAQNDRLGSVALSSDGDTALVGASGDNANRGAVYVFVRSNGLWTQQQKLTASDGASPDCFGSRIALSSDGNTALIGASGNSGDGGAAYVFRRNSSIWTQQAKLTASDGAEGDSFGRYLALSGDGAVALIGADNRTVGGNASQGQAYLFAFNGISWIQHQTLTASDGAANDHFGEGVAISSDSGTVLVAAPRKAIGANAHQGAVYALTFSGSSWVHQQLLTASNGVAYDSFGMSVSLSGDGKTILVDSIGQTSISGPEAYLFQWNGASWTEQQILTGSDGAAGDQVSSAGFSISSDGMTFLFGAPGKNSNQGSLYVFVSQFYILPLASGATVSCLPIPVLAHMDASCTITPDSNHHITDVRYRPSSSVTWTIVEPTSKYLFSDVTDTHYLNATGTLTDIWLYNTGLNPPLLYIAHSIGESFIAAAFLALQQKITEVIRVPIGAFAGAGGFSCLAQTNNVTLSGGWNSATSRNAFRMSTIAGPLSIGGLCTLALDGITVE